MLVLGIQQHLLDADPIAADLALVRLKADKTKVMVHIL